MPWFRRRGHPSPAATAPGITDAADDTPALESGMALPAGGDGPHGSEPETRTEGAVGQGGWIAAARVVSQATQFLTVVVAARAMGPAEFGTFALLSATAIGLTRFSEAGWREYVMAAEGMSAPAQANTLAALCGAGSFALGLVASLVLASLQGETAGAAVMALLSFWVLLATLSATQAGMLVKRGRLRVFAFGQIAGEVLGLLAALLVFAMGGGIFGLVASRLAMQACVLAISLGATRWFPLPGIEAQAAREAYRFSARILATRLISYFQDNVAIFAIGAIVGSAGAGLFRAAARLGGALLDVISEPMRLMAWSTFRSGEPGKAADRLFGLALTVSTPFFVGLAATADDAVGVLLGPGWADSAPLLVAFALAGWLSVFNVATEPLLVVRDRIALVPRISLALTVVHLAILLMLAPFGILWVAIGQFISAALMLPFVLAVQRRHGGISLRSLAARALPALLGAAALLAAVWATRAALSGEAPQWLRMAAEIGAGAAAYVAVAALLVPRHVWTLKDASSGK